MQTPYEILIRFDDAGNYKGGHSITRDSETGKTSKATPITEAQWPTVCADINTAVLASHTEAQQQITELTANQKELEELRTFKTEAEKPAKQKELEAADAQIAQLQAKRAEIASKLEIATLQT